MNKKISLLIILIIFSFNTVFAMTLTDNIPYYIAVNDSFKVEVTDDINGSEFIIMTIGNEINPMTYDEANNLYYLYISSDEEIDIPYYILESRSQSIFNLGGSLNYTDDYLIDSVEGNEDYFFLFHEMYNITNDSTLKANVCANLRKESLNRHVVFTIGAYNGTHYNYDYSEPVLIDDNTYNVHCGYDINITYNYTGNTNLSTGFFCTDCDTNGILLSTETDSEYLGHSATYDNTTNTYTNINTYNFDMATILFSSAYEPTSISGTLRFRIPFNVEIQIYKSNETLIPSSEFKPYCNEFSQVYMKDYSEVDILDTSQQTSIMNNFFNFFDIFKLRGAFDSLSTYSSNTVNNDLYFTANYDECRANITLYETGNYSAYVLSGRTNQDTDYTYIFTDPKDGTEKLASRISGDDVLVFNTKTDNYIVKIIASDWDISKIDVIINIIKFIIIVGIPTLLVFLIRSGVAGAILVKVIK